jgi:hypothetical protein
MQVHNAVAAHLNTHTQAILPLAATTTIRATMVAQTTPDSQGIQSTNAGTPPIDASFLSSPTETLQVQSEHPRRSQNIPSGMANSLY